MFNNCASFASDCFKAVFCNESAPILTTETSSFKAEEASKIEVYGQLEQKINSRGQQESFLKVQVTLLEEVVDEQHDMLYLVK